MKDASTTAHGDISMTPTTHGETPLNQPAAHGGAWHAAARRVTVPTVVTVVDRFEDRRRVRSTPPPWPRRTRARHLSGSAAVILLVMGGAPSSSLAGVPVTATPPPADTQDGTSHPDGLHVPVQPAVFGTEPEEPEPREVIVAQSLSTGFPAGSTVDLTETSPAHPHSKPKLPRCFTNSKRSLPTTSTSGRALGSPVEAKIVG
jgi:hypothetical protein